MTAPAPALAPATMRVAALEAFIADALVRVGVGEADARTTALALATTDSWGVHTHGVKCLKGYVQRLRRGGLDPRAIPVIVAEGPAWARIDGRSALGMVTSVMAMRSAMAKARACGVGYAGVTNSCHFGAAGYYAALAAEAGFVGLAMANDAPSMSVPGSTARVLGNNPFAFAAPCGGGLVMLDMALSTVAGGKLMAAHALGQRIPADWSIDAEGEPTTDPAVFLAGGALTPTAGHKGVGLALMVEVLSAVLTGANLTAAVLPWLVETARPTGHGAAFLALDIEAFLPRAEFDRRIRALADGIRASPRKAGCARISIPGDLEAERRAAALRDGLVLPGDVVAALRAVAADVGLPVDHLLSGA